MIHRLASIGLGAALLASPAMAQPAGAGPDARRSVRHPSATREAPLDRGPFTPEASRAYNGGGVVLEGAPGGPAPTPRAMPPGGMPSPQ